MKREEFVSALKNKLKRYNANEVEEAVAYYDELILDMVSDGKDEEEAVASLGSIASITATINGDILKKNSANEVFASILTILGVCLSPALLPIAILLAALYLVLFIVFITFIICFGTIAVASLALGVNMFFTANSLGANLMSFGLSIIFATLMSYITYYTCKYSFKIIRYITIKINDYVHKITTRREKNENI